MNKTNTLLIILLTLSGILLSILIPGGPIENRDFSHINPLILLAFNIFLTLLGLGTFAIIPFVFRHLKGAIQFASLAATGYFFVYMLDLLGWFPRSPTPMSASLFWIEVAGLFISIPMFMLSITLLKDIPKQMIHTKNSKQLWVKCLFFIVALAIIIFSTCSAIG